MAEKEDYQNGLSSQVHQEYIYRRNDSQRSHAEL